MGSVSLAEKKQLSCDLPEFERLKVQVNALIREMQDLDNYDALRMKAAAVPPNFIITWSQDCLATSEFGRLTWFVSRLSSS